MRGCFGQIALSSHRHEDFGIHPSILGFRCRCSDTDLIFEAAGVSSAAFCRPMPF